MPTAIVAFHQRLLNRMAEFNLAATVLALISALISLVVYFSSRSAVEFPAKIVLTLVWGLADLALSAAGVMILLDGIIERWIVSIVGGAVILIGSNAVMAGAIWLWVTGAP